MIETIRYQTKWHRSSSLVPILAISVLGAAMVSCSDYRSSPYDGGLSDRTGNAQNQSDPAGGVPVVCRYVIDGLVCPSGEGWRFCEEYSGSQALLAEVQYECEELLKGTISTEPCPTDFREKCKAKELSVYYYHNCESDVDRQMLEEGCKKFLGGGEFTTK